MLESAGQLEAAKPVLPESDDKEDLRRLRIGPRVRAARRLRGMTLSDLAAVTGYSASLLSRVENEKTVPSIPTLLRLSKALDVDLVSFFKGDGDTAILSKPHQRQRLKGLPHSHETELEILVSRAEGRLIEAFLVKLGPGGHGGKPVSHEGEELGYVIEGRLELTVAGRTYVAEPGDSFHFPTNLEHSYRNASSETTALVWVNTPPPSASRLRK